MCLRMVDTQGGVRRVRWAPSGDHEEGPKPVSAAVVEVAGAVSRRL
jgi:hypothetical protein